VGKQIHLKGLENYWQYSSDGMKTLETNRSVHDSIWFKILKQLGYVLAVVRTIFRNIQFQLYNLTNKYFLKTSTTTTYSFYLSFLTCHSLHIDRSIQVAVVLVQRWIKLSFDMKSFLLMTRLFFYLWEAFYRFSFSYFSYTNCGLS